MQLVLSCLGSIFFAVVCLLAVSGNVMAAPETLNLASGENERSLTEHIEVLRDPTGKYSVSDIMEGKGGPFQRLGSERIDFGFTDDTIWLKLTVANRSERAGTWVLATNTNFMNRLEAWLIHGGGTHLIAKDSENAPFSARQFPYRHVTGTFSLGAGEQAVMVIGYRSGGSTALPLSIETESGFLGKRISEAVWNTVFFTSAAAMIVLSLLFMPIMRRRLHLAYAMYLSWIVLYVAHIEGYTFQFLWPDLPRWNAFASLPLGYGLAIFAAIFAREFLGPKLESRKIELTFNVVIWTTAALMFSSFVIDNQWLKKFGFLYVSFISVVFIGILPAFLRDNRPGLSYFIVGWLVIFAASVYSTLAHWSPGALSVDASFDIMRAGILFQGLMFAAAIAAQTWSYRRERDAAMHREMLALKQNMALERSHAYVRALADARQAQLASASHDLKQPLVSLKLMLRRAIGPRESTTVETMRRAVDYLDGLVRRYLDEAAVRAPGGPPEVASGGEEFDVSLILNNVTAMFAEEARSRGGELRLVPSAARIAAEPMPVMRIISNFVSNAVKHASQGQVLVGCRRREGHVRIEVHDRGPGLDEARLRRLREAYEAGAPAGLPREGGLGLAIALDLIIRHGYGFDVKARAGRGTVFTLILPAASGAPALNGD